MSVFNSAVDRILAIPELFESILLELPERNLLLEQRVNTQWHETIETSPALQHKLFFRAEVFADGHPITTDFSSIKWNPLLELFLVGPSARPKSVSGPNDEVWINWNKLRDTRGQDYATVSWKRLYLTQPAIKRIVEFRFNGEGLSLSRCIFSKPFGLKICYLGSIRFNGPNGMWRLGCLDVTFPYWRPFRQIFMVSLCRLIIEVADLYTGTLCCVPWIKSGQIGSKQ